MNTQERNQQVKDYIEAALALFSLESEISEEVIENMMFTFANEQKEMFESLFLDLDEYPTYDYDINLLLKLHENLIFYLNNKSFTSIEVGIRQHKQWIELRNEDYAEQKRDEANEHYLSVNDRV